MRKVRRSFTDLAHLNSINHFLLTENTDTKLHRKQSHWNSSWKCIIHPDSQSGFIHDLLCYLYTQVNTQSFLKPRTGAAVHSAIPSAAKLQTQINPLFSVSPHLTADPISSACTRTHPACSHQKGRPHSAGCNPTPPPSCSGVTNTGRGSRRRKGATQAAFRSQDKEQLMRGRIGRGKKMYCMYVLGRKWRMVMVSLLTVNVEREAFFSPLSPAPKFPEFFPVRLN